MKDKSYMLIGRQHFKAPNEEEQRPHKTLLRLNSNTTTISKDTSNGYYVLKGTYDICGVYYETPPTWEATISNSGTVRVTPNYLFNNPTSRRCLASFLADNNITLRSLTGTNDLARVLEELEDNMEDKTNDY